MQESTTNWNVFGIGRENQSKLKANSGVKVMVVNVSAQETEDMG